MLCLTCYMWRKSCKAKSAIRCSTETARAATGEIQHLVGRGMQRILLGVYIYYLFVGYSLTTLVVFRLLFCPSLVV